MKLIYIGDFDTLEQLGFKKDTPLRYRKDSLYVGVNSKRIFIPIDWTGNSICVLFDLIQLNLVKKEVE